MMSAMKHMQMNVKGMATMDNLNNYVDLCLIDEYAINGSLDVDSLPALEVSNLLNELMARDTAVKDYVLHAMQQLIDKRLEERELTDRSDTSYSLVHLSNGDTLMQLRRNA